MSSPVPSAQTALVGATAAEQLQKQTEAKLTAKHDPKQIEKVAREFEAMFISSMLQPVFASKGAAGAFAPPHGEDTYKAMLVDEYGKVIARRGGLGIAEAVKRQMLSLQETK